MDLYPFNTEKSKKSLRGKNLLFFQTKAQAIFETVLRVQYLASCPTMGPFGKGVLRNVHYAWLIAIRSVFYVYMYGIISIVGSIDRR